MTLIQLALFTIAIWGYLLFFRPGFADGFWRSEPSLDAAQSPPPKWPSVAIIIPARNEAETIGAVVRAAAGTDYPSPVYITVVDDNSDDGTGKITQDALGGSDAGQVITGKPLADGWAGKLWALKQGLEAAAHQTPDARYVLFLDADIVLAPKTLRRLVEKAEAQSLNLTSLMARLDSRGWGAILIPAFIYFFQKLYPFSCINNPDESRAGAAGGCMLIRRDALDEIGGIAALQNTLIDDCSLAQKIKDLSPQSKIWLGHGRGDAISLRDNRSFHSIWVMVTRSAYTQLRHSPLLFTISIIGMMMTYLAPPLIVLTSFYHGQLFASAISMIAFAMMAYSYSPTLTLYDRPQWEVLAFPVAAALYTAMIISSAWQHWVGAGAKWKGRHYNHRPQ